MYANFITFMKIRSYDCTWSHVKIRAYEISSICFCFLFSTNQIMLSRFSSFMFAFISLCILHHLKAEEESDFLEGKEAEDKFIKEEVDRMEKIQKMKEDLVRVKKELSIVRVLKSLYNPVEKAFEAIRAMWYIFRRDSLTFFLKRKERQEKTERLFHIWESAQKMCERAFNHEYFTMKGWVLLKEHKKTKQKKMLYIKVQTDHQDEPEQPELAASEPRKFWRTSKLCMAKKHKTDEYTPNEPFRVYISAAEGYGWNYEIFVFTELPPEKLDFFQRYVLFWQHVVKVEAFLLHRPSEKPLMWKLYENLPWR